MIATAFDVDGCVVEDVHDPDSQHVLAAAQKSRLRPLCLCREPGVPMYIAAAGADLIVKRMPGTALDHDHRCRSWLPPAELSGFGAVAGQSIVDDPAAGTTSLRLGFSLSKSGGRPAPQASGEPSSTVATDGNKLSLRAVLHYLWDEAELTTWEPGFAGHRSWAVVYRRVQAAVAGTVVRKLPLAESLFMPEPFAADRKAEIERRRIKAWAPARQQPGKPARLLIGVGEVKAIEPAAHGFKVQVRHQPGHPWFLNDDLHRRLQKRFERDLELWQMSEPGEVHLVAICLFSVSRAGYATVEQMSLMATDRNWLPFCDDLDRTLLATAIDAQRSFRKVLAYNSDPVTVASLILTDTAPATAAVINWRGIASEPNAEIAGLPVWSWDIAGDMPDLPPRADDAL